MNAKFIQFILLSFFLCGCFTTEYNVATHQEDIFFFSTEKEVSLGKNVARKVREQFSLEKHPHLNDKIFDIGRRIAQVCDRKEINYYFYIIDNEEKNAFSLPGGYVYIFKGLLDLLDSDDEIAFVLAHEIGHIVARHHIKQLQASLGANLLLIASSQMPASGNISGLQGVSLILNTILSGYSQDDEFLSDRLAVKYARLSGYDPKAGLKVMKKIQEAHRKDEPRKITYFRSHPYIAQRIRRIKLKLGIPLEFQDAINY